MARRWAARLPAVVLVALAAAAGGVGVFRAASVPPAATPTAASPSAGLTRPAPEVPAFAQPEQARRYFDAKEKGYRRAVEVLDQAIAQASRDPGITPEHLAVLRRTRAERVAALEATRPVR
jgi:hypothetical protein